MRKTYKQWLAAVLCLVCMWAMAPAGAGAEEEAYYPFALPGVLEVVQLNNVPPTAQVLTLWGDLQQKGKAQPQCPVRKRGAFHQRRGNVSLYHDRFRGPEPAGGRHVHIHGGPVV